MFFFLWTNDGGPLQYIGLALFLLQILPLAFPSLHQALLQHACVLGCLVGAAPALYLLYRMYRDGMTFDQVHHLAAERVGMAIALVRGLGRQAADGGRAAPGGNTLSEIINIVASMPMEEYVPDAEDSYDKCSISQLKKMLEVRKKCNASIGNNASCSRSSTCNAPPLDCFVERRELVEAVRQCRTSNDSCIICFEEYDAGDPIRVLPQCGHEFHVECVDQWAYTYASSDTNRRNQSPSCPLCKVALR